MKKSDLLGLVSAYVVDYNSQERSTKFKDLMKTLCMADRVAAHYALRGMSHRALEEIKCSHENINQYTDSRSCKDCGAYSRLEGDDFDLWKSWTDWRL